MTGQLKSAIEKIRSTKVDAGNLKHELLNRLRSTTAVNVLTRWATIKLSRSLLYRVSQSVSISCISDDLISTSI